MLDIHDVPAAERCGREPRTTQAAHPPARKRPELIARRPNQVWSWDITKLPGPERGSYYELFVIIDIFSRYVVGWTVARTETGELARDFINACLTTQGVGRDQLSLHADRGSSITSKPVAQLFVTVTSLPQRATTDSPVGRPMPAPHPRAR